MALPLGAHPGNTGGKKGRSGRKPLEFKDFLSRVRQDPKLHAALRKALRDPESRGFSSALKVLTDYDEQKPAQRIALDIDRLSALTDAELAALVAAAQKAK